MGKIMHGGWLNNRGLYQCWQDMKQRCYNKRNHNYKNYGARGIVVCKRWLNSFENFLADMGERAPGFTLERKNNNGHYKPSNCVWATRAEQRRNQRGNVHITFNGKRMTREEWARNLGLHSATLQSRLNRGWSISNALQPLNTAMQRAKGSGG